VRVKIIGLVIILAAAGILSLLILRAGRESAPVKTVKIAGAPVSSPVAPRTKPAVPSGRQVYEVAQAAEVWPKILQATIDPPDVHVGDTQKLAIIVEDSVQITSVEAQIQTDNKTITLPLTLVGPVSKGELLPQKYAVDASDKLVLLDAGDGAKDAASNIPNTALAADLQKLKYEGEWVVRDTHDTFYHTTFIAKDQSGRTSSITLAWSDACGIPLSGDWTLASPCAISSTDGIDNGNATIPTSTLTLNGTFAFNPGKSITLSGAGSIVIGTGGQIKKAYICGPDADNDGYLNGLFAATNSTCSDLGATYKRRSAVGGTQTFQTRSPTTVVDDAAVGTQIWGTPANAVVSDDVYATTSMPASAISHYLTGYNFGFTIPASARIDGIKIEYEMSSQAWDTNGDGVYGTLAYTPGLRAVKSFVRLQGPSFAKTLKDFLISSVVETAYAITYYLDGYAPRPGPENPPAAPNWSADTYEAAGDSAYKWNNSWTPADINAAGFGASLALQALNDRVDARVDSIRVTVWYTDPPPIAGVSDCDDSRADKWQMLTGYLDNDADTYTTGAAVQVCSGDRVASPYRGTQTTEDCYDANPNANPASTAYFTKPRGSTSTGAIAADTSPSGSSFDYNCDGVETKNVTSYNDPNSCFVSLGAACGPTLEDCAPASCSTLTSTSTPACGLTYTKITGCALSGPYCGTPCSTTKTNCSPTGLSSSTVACR
jgi:hypothetical protein